MGDLMRYKVPLFILLALGMTLVLVATVSALEPERITDDIHSQWDPDMSSRYIVWQDGRHGDSEIYSYDLVGSNGVVRVSNNPVNRDEYPRVDSDRVAWRSRDDSSGWYQVYFKNLTTGQQREIYNDTNYLRGHNIGDDYVLYSYEEWTGTWSQSLYKYRISSQTSTLVYSFSPTSWGDINNIEILGNKAIFFKRDDNSKELIHFDLVNDQILKTLSIPENTGWCGFSTNQVLVCYTWDGGPFTLNINTQQYEGLELGLTLGESSGYKVSGKHIVYMNFTVEDFGYDLFSYKLDTKETVRLTYTPSSPEYYFTVSGNMVSYISSKSVFPDLYLMRLPQDPPDLAISKNEVVLNPSFPVVNEPCELNVIVQNVGRSDADAKVRVTFRTTIGPPMTMTQDSGTITKGQFFMVKFQDINFIRPGYYTMSVEVDHRIQGTQIPELNLDNNKVKVEIYVNGKPSPIIDPVDPIEVPTFDPVPLDGSNSFDKDGISVYSWDFGDGTGAIGPKVTHSWADDGAYVVTLTVYDIYGAMNSTTKIVNITNRPPEAVWSVPAIMPRGKEVVLNAIGSYDDDGAITEVAWDIPGEDDPLIGQFITYVFTQEDQLVTVILNVTDDDGALTTVQLQIELVDEDARNIPPVAVITVTGNGGNLTMSAIGSFDPNGIIETYEWTFDDGSTDTGDTVTKMFPEGDHFITLNIEDDEGLTDTAVVAVSISYTEPPDIIQEVYGNTTVVNRIDGNEAPSVTASFDILDNKTGEVSFTGTASDPDGNITNYQWDFDGDGVWDFTSTSTASTTNTYTKPGFYTAILRVTDDNGTSAVTVLSVAIKTDEIGKTVVKSDSEAGGVDMTMLIIVLVLAIVIAAVVAVVAAKKFAAPAELDIASQEEVNELNRLVEDSKMTGAQVDEAEAIVRQLEGR